MPPLVALGDFGMLLDDRGDVGRGFLGLPGERLPALSLTPLDSLGLRIDDARHFPR